MTLKDKINEVLDLSEVALRRGNHEQYQMCIALIADMLRDSNEIEIVEE